MQVALENIGELARKLNVTIPAEEVEQEINKRLQKLKTEVKMDGFRPGKIPYPILKQRFEPSVRAEVIDVFANRGLNDAIKENELQITVQPELKDVKAKTGEVMEITLELEVFPELKLKELKEIEVDTIELEVGEKDAENVLNKMLKLNPSYQTVKRSVKKDDRLNLSIKTSIISGADTDKLNEELEAYEYVHTFDQEHNIKEFDAAIKDVKPGEVREFDMQYTTDHRYEKFAGKKVHHHITVNKIEAPVFPKLDEAFAKQMGVQDGGVEKLKESVLKQIIDQAKNMQLEANRERLFDKLITIHELELPPKLLHKEIENLKAMNYPDKSAEELSKIETTKEAQKQAEIHVKRSLLIQALMQQFKIELDSKRLQQELMKLLQQYQNPTEVLKQFKPGGQQYARLQAYVLEQQLVEELMKNVKTNVKTIDYSTYIDKDNSGVEENETINS